MNRTAPKEQTEPTELSVQSKNNAKIFHIIELSVDISDYFCLMKLITLMRKKFDPKIALVGETMTTR